MGKKKSDYSDDRLSITQEIAEGLKKRGIWVPEAWWSSDILSAIMKAIDVRDDALRASRDAFMNVTAIYCTPVAKLKLRETWKDEHKLTEDSIREAMEKIAGTIGALPEPESI